MDFTAGVFVPSPIEFTLHPSNSSSFDPLSPGYAAGDDPDLLIPLSYSAGGEFVCTQINGECGGLAAEPKAWGAVKMLFR